MALEFREGGIADTVLHFKYDKHNKYHRAGRKLLITAISLVMFVEAWWVISIIANSYTIPNPADTWDALVDFYSNGDTMSGGKSMWSYISSSLSTYLEGFILALVVSIPLGLVLGKFATLREFATPMIEVLRPIAPIAWAPIFMVAIDYETGPMLVVFVGIFFPLLTNVIFGVSKIEPNLIDASKTLGASDAQIFVKVMIPSTVPYIMNGIKVGLGIGWMCIVAAELYASPLGGIGFYLSEQATAGFWPSAYAAIVIIAVLGILTSGLADYIHKYISKRMGMDV
ncbi:MAG: ABC transporter permease [Candidatus Methanomethylophilus sp.]|nr:ABC transporter permease [Methanomethylophilus sp.]MCI2074247.1 ABC transporter permease [Methanomethylophilus sp.]MCI2092956.1 ABC transporter permease [Methanomethylophilus sp.]WII09437.1 ABC transporter permease [Methanomassiliicoccales archaeon LGM-DZ1]